MSAARPCESAAPDLSISIVSYRTPDLVGSCLRSVLADLASPLTAEIFVVDNAPGDGTAEMVRSEFPSVRLIESGRNLGFGRANNLAITASRGRYVLVLNPDTVVQPGTLSALVRFADAHPRAGAVGCRLVGEDGSLQHSCFLFPNLRMAWLGFFPLIPLDSTRNGRYPEARYQRAFHTQHTLGACLLVRQQAIDEVGAFDERFFMYFEETDWCYRLRQRGWQIYYTPEASVVHVGAASTSVVKEEMSVQFACSQAQFYRKHYGWRGYLALKVIVAAGLTHWAARSSLAYLRRRIPAGLLRQRMSNYWRILRF